MARLSRNLSGMSHSCSAMMTKGPRCPACGDRLRSKAGRGDVRGFLRQRHPCLRQFDNVWSAHRQAVCDNDDDADVQPSGARESRVCQIVQPLFKICLSRRRVLFQWRTSLRHLKPPLGAAVVILIQWRATRCQETTASIPSPFHGGTAAPALTGHMTVLWDASCRAEGGLSAMTPSGQAIL